MYIYIILYDIYIYDMIYIYDIYIWYIYALLLWFLLLFRKHDLWDWLRLQIPVQSTPFLSLQVPGSSTFDVDPTVNGVSAPVKGLVFSDMENDP